MIKDKIFSENVSMTQALQNGVHEASVPVIAKSNNAGCRVWWPYIVVNRWNSIIFGIVGLSRKREEEDYEKSG